MKVKMLVWEWENYWTICLIFMLEDVEYLIVKQPNH